MAYTSNYVEVLAETGEYEAEIINADVRNTSGGKEYLNLAFRLSNKLVVYDKIWRDFMSPSDFNKKRVASLLTALKIEEELADDYALVQAIKDKKLIVSVTKEFNDKLSKEVNNVKEYKQLQDIIVTDEDLPF